MIIGTVGKILKELETTRVMSISVEEMRKWHKKNSIISFRNTLILIISLFKKGFVCLFVYVDFQRVYKASFH